MPYTFSQLTEVPLVMKIIQEYNSPGSTFSRFYKLGITDRPGQVLPKRSGLYDIFNPTRTMPTARANMAGPSRVARKPIGQKAVVTARFYESLEITHEEVYGNRPLGGQYGTVDSTGESYIARQISHEIDKFNNLHEFLAFQAMRGGWSYISYNDGEDLYPVVKGTAGAVMDVETLIPAENQGQLPIGPSDADIIDVPWNDPSAKIVKQLQELDKIHAVRNGNPLRHIWLNGSTMAPLFDNTQLRSVVGTAFTIFQSMTRRAIDPGQMYPDTGYDVVFGALPNWVFHVYNQVYIPGLVGNDFASQTSMDNIKFYIPDGEAIITPNPGDWCEKVAGTEPVQWNRHEAVQYKSGFCMGRTFEIEPPRIDLKFLENYAPVITQHSPAYNPTVWFED